MAVNEVDYRAGDPQSAQFDERLRGTYVLRYLIRTGTPMGANEMLADSQSTTFATYTPDPTGRSGQARTVKVPTMFCRYEYESSYDENSLCKSITVDQVATLTDGGQKWSVVATFRPNELNESGNDSHGNPSLRPALVTWDRETFREEVQHGIPEHPSGEGTVDRPKQAGEDGEAVEIRNTAGGLYESPVEVIKTRSVIVVSYKVLDLNAASKAVSKYQGTINKEEFKIYTDGQDQNHITVQAGTGLTREVLVSEQHTESSYNYYTVQFRIAIEPRGWLHQAVERGREHLVSTDGSDESGEPQPARLEFAGDYVTLDKDGHKVGLDDDGNLPDTTTTNWTVYARESYSGLPFTTAPEPAADPCP